VIGVFAEVLKILEDMTKSLTPDLKEKKIPLILSVFRSVSAKKHGTRILDLGSSENYSINPSLFPKNSEVYALDFRPPKGPRSVKGDASTIPFKSNTFDIVVASELLEHVASPSKVVREIVRVLKKDGMVFVTTPWLWELLREPHFQLFAYPMVKRYSKKGNVPRFYKETFEQTLKFIRDGKAHVSWHPPFFWRRLLKKYFEHVKEIGIPIKPLVGYTHKPTHTFFTACFLVYILAGPKQTTS